MALRLVAAPVITLFERGGAQPDRPVPWACEASLCPTAVLTIQARLPRKEPDGSPGKLIYNREDFAVPRFDQHGKLLIVSLPFLVAHDFGHVGFQGAHVGNCQLQD